MISKQQDCLYWRHWSKCAKRLAGFGFDREEIDDKRRQMTSEATAGRTESHKDMRKVGEFTEWLKLATALHSPDNLDAQLDLQAQPAKVRAHLISTVEAHGLPDSYLNKISLDQFGVNTWRDLPVDQIRLLRMTAKSRASKHPLQT